MQITLSWLLPTAPTPKTAALTRTYVDDATTYLSMGCKNHREIFPCINGTDNDVVLFALQVLVAAGLVVLLGLWG